MNDEHVEAFLGEANERITDLNNSLLTFEANPGDREAMDSIFRTAHTLKGNFGAMGFEEESRLAHALEDLLDELRGERLEPTPDVMDLAFEGVDGIEASIHGIESDGELSLDVDPTIDALRELIEEGEISTNDVSTPPPTDDGDALFDACSEDESVFDVVVEPRDGEMAGVEAMLAAEAIETAFDTVLFEENSEDVSGPFSVAVIGESEESVEQAFDGIGKIQTATVSKRAQPTEEKTGTRTAERPAEEIRAVRVDVDRLDELHGLVEQLVTSRIKLRRATEQNGDSTTDAIDELDKITTNLQNVVMDVRLIPLEKVVSTLPRLVRDLARDEEKRIDFSMDGEDVELDRTILSELSDPLMHILRNSIDHGIESPEKRAKNGKPETGRIELRASRDRDHAVIEIEDDGRGLDREAIEENAVETGISRSQSFRSSAPKRSTN